MKRLANTKISKSHITIDVIFNISDTQHMFSKCFAPYWCIGGLPDLQTLTDAGWSFIVELLATNLSLF
jgi:hypothetical protein